MLQSPVDSSPSFLVSDTRPHTRYESWDIPNGGLSVDRIQVLQRVYKFGGQPFVRDYLAKNHGNEFDAAFGKGNGKAIMHATAGRYVEALSAVRTIPDLNVQLDRHRRDCPSSTRRPEDQASNQPRGFPRSRCCANRQGRGFGTIPRLGMDGCS